MKLRGNKIPRFFVQYSHWERRKLRCFFFSALGFGIFNYSSMTSNIILAPSLKLFWKIKQSVMV